MCSVLTRRPGAAANGPRHRETVHLVGPQIEQARGHIGGAPSVTGSPARRTRSPTDRRACAIVTMILGRIAVAEVLRDERLEQLLAQTRRRRAGRSACARGTTSLGQDGHASIVAGDLRETGSGTISASARRVDRVGGQHRQRRPPMGRSRETRIVAGRDAARAPAASPPARAVRVGDRDAAACRCARRRAFEQVHVANRPGAGAAACAFVQLGGNRSPPVAARVARLGPGTRGRCA